MTNKDKLLKGTTIRVQIKVKSKKKKLTDWGLGPGIIAEQDVVIQEDVTEKNAPSFARKLNEIYDDLLDETFKREINVVEGPKKKTKRKTK